LRSAFAFRSPARALAAGLPRQDHFQKTTDESFRFQNKKFDEMRCKLDPLRIRVRSRNTQTHHRFFHIEQKWCCFRSVGEKNKKEKGEEGREKRGERRG